MMTLQIAILKKKEKKKTFLEALIKIFIEWVDYQIKRTTRKQNDKY